MKKIIALTILALFFTTCSQSRKEQHSKTPAEINQENAERDKGDHVKDSKMIPPMTPQEKKQYIDSAKFVAKTAFNIFSSHLQRWFEENHPAEALTYCKENAQRITDSLSIAHGVKIKRTSFRLRNPKKNPNNRKRR